MYEAYRSKLQRKGGNIREANKLQSVQLMESTFADSQSYRQVKINEELVDARFIEGSSTTIRGGLGNFEIQFRDGFDPPAGTYVHIPIRTTVGEEYEPWLIVYKADDALFPKHIIRKCNYELKWKNTKGEIITRWCIFSDNQKLMDAERDTYYNKMKLSSFGFPLMLPLDPETINIKIDKRFLIDHPDIEGNPEAWIVTNRNVSSKTFEGYDGVVELTISRHQYNHNTDNKELMIADFYQKDLPPEDFDDDVEYDIRITYSNSPDLKMATPFKSYKAEFQKDGAPDDTLIADWDVIIPEELETKFTYNIIDNLLKIKCSYDNLMIGTHIRIRAYNDSCGCSAELPIKVVSTV